jgi:hypothetical protein
MNNDYQNHETQIGIGLINGEVNRKGSIRIGRVYRMVTLPFVKDVVLQLNLQSA